ncbi:MAG: FtsQ-type POTRA domain-containing protein [Oscillospiraceae bacterium]|nr:FtsQ-type POTRA domain-containing protein [Oscillospiraceae bacterium]
MRNDRRRGNMSLHYSLIAFIALVVFAILSTTVFFNIENADIIGSSIYSADEIIAASGIHGGDNMIRTNMGKAEKAIVSELLYIEEARISRKLPSSVEILIVPCIETASLQTEDGYYIVSESGKILRAEAEPAEDTLVFLGTEPAEDMQVGMKFASADEDKTEVIYELMAKAEDGFASKITSFDVTDRLNISCLYEDRITVEINSTADIDYKFRLAEEILDTKISPDAEGRLKLLESGAQFLSNDDIAQNEQTFEMNMQTSAATETTPAEETENTAEEEKPSEEVSSTHINFE